ncbi:hypothetical protein MAMT_01820 [Methylacidimicrobium tartarophylax]|uniref:Uncharacterized protein n=1 Tax=Methylacidimicrobium tartarophylax TaxID=1041768 RepID=A0A5E6MEF6_9BACT|nr:hypothetical protein MAMT_01820 [Methylacidimicrobium tartarophylax]
MYYTETHGPTAIRTVWQQIPWLKIPDGVMKRSPLIDKGDHHALRSAIEAFMDYWGFTPKQRQEWEQTHWKDVYNGKTSKGATVHPYTMFLANLFRYSTFAWLQQDPTNRPNELERLWPSVDKAIDDVTQALKGPARILAKCYGGHEIKAYVEGVLYLTDRLKQNPNVTHEEVWEVVRETKDLIHAKEEDASMDSLTSKEGMGPFERVMREAASDKQGRKRKFEAGGEMVAEPDAMTRFKAYCDYKKANPTKSDRNTCRILAAREVAQIEDKMARQRESELVDARAKRIRDAISAIKKQRRESGQPPLI